MRDMVRLIGLGLVGTVIAHGAVLTWDDGYASDSRIDRTANWDPAGLPDIASGNTGVVGTGFNTTIWNNATIPGYRITYTGNSTLAGENNLRPTAGAHLVFKDTSAFTVGRLDLSYNDLGDTTFEFHDSATGTMTDRFNFGVSTVLNSNAHLILSGNAVVKHSEQMGFFGDANTTHTITLRDGAQLLNETTSGALFAQDGVNVVMNFEQSDLSKTPVWSVLKSVNLNQTWLQYQINGENVNISDERFVVTEGDVYKTVALIPETRTVSLFIVSTIGLCLARRSRI